MTAIADHPLLFLGLLWASAVFIAVGLLFGLVAWVHSWEPDEVRSVREREAALQEWGA